MHLQFKTKPFQHQLQVLEASKDKEYFAVFWEMGLGKTKYALDQSAYLYNAGKIKQVLFITKNGVDQQIIEESVPEHLPLLESQYFTDCWRDYDGCWPKLKKFKDFVSNKLVIVALNCEALGTKKGYQAIKDFALRGPTLLIVDESQEFSGISAKRTENLIKIAGGSGNLFAYRRLMSGTPTGGNPLHYYAQMQILSDKIFPMSKWSFEYVYCVKERQGTWMKAKTDIWKNGKLVVPAGKPYQKFFEVVTGYKNLDKLHAVVAKYSDRKTKDECLDLPPKIYKKCSFVLADEEQKLYNKVKSSTLAELAPGKYVSTEMAITKLLRLQQITCGFVAYEDLITGERAKTLLPYCTRLKRLIECCEQVNGKALIWSRFTTSVDQIVEKLGEVFGKESVVRYDGTVSSAQKQENKLAFKKSPEVRWLVGHPKAGGVGLDLPEASTVIYYSNDHHLISRLQSEDRAHRIGSKEAVTYIDLLAQNTIDNKILTALKSRFDIATQLTGDQLKEWIK